MNDTRILIADVLERINTIEEYAHGMDSADFENDRKTQDAVIRNLEVIGEIVKRIPDDFRSDYPQVPWKKIAGMRDKLIHDYLGIDIQAVWLVVEESLPELKEEISEILKDL